MNEDKRIDITDSEWNVLSCLWEESPQTARTLAQVLAKTVGWSRSTTLTVLRRMTEKGLLLCEEGADGVYVYRTELLQEAVTLREADRFLDRVFGGSISMMLSAMTAGKRLTGEEIDALYEVLREAELMEEYGKQEGVK
ncbi:MAG: BlaI/MecI/CopY family transcriptional regulator [Clostridia bacterium]|nr:BlaI/MecI/CopY family transcriptional regulator [Clostridia bacterium]